VVGVVSILVAGIVAAVATIQLEGMTAPVTAPPALQDPRP
jgi:hypothetical protein